MMTGMSGGLTVLVGKRRVRGEYADKNAAVKMVVEKPHHKICSSSGHFRRILSGTDRPHSQKDAWNAVESFEGDYARGPTAVV